MVVSTASDAAHWHVSDTIDQPSASSLKVMALSGQRATLSVDLWPVMVPLASSEWNS
jgi:hypothetical protein